MATKKAALRCLPRRQVTAMMSEIVTAAMTTYGALSFPDKCPNRMDAIKSKFIRTTFSFTCSVSIKVILLATKQILNLGPSPHSKAKYSTLVKSEAVNYLLIAGGGGG